jgi:hypothetical protein
MEMVPPASLIGMDDRAWLTCWRMAGIEAASVGTTKGTGQVLRSMRCSGACGGRVGATQLVTGPTLNARVRPRRVAPLGPEARE